MQAQVEMLVVSNSPAIREGLQSLALTLPHVGKVYIANDNLRSLPRQDETNPSLILLDCTLPLPKCQKLLSQVKFRWPQIKSVALVDTEDARLQLAGIGVDMILLKGVPAVRLLAILKRLLHAARCA